MKPPRPYSESLAFSNTNTSSFALKVDTISTGSKFSSLSTRAMEVLTLADMVIAVEADFSDEVVMTNILQQQPDVIFHLAAIVSGEAEKNFQP